MTIFPRASVEVAPEVTDVVVNEAEGFLPPAKDSTNSLAQLLAEPDRRGIIRPRTAVRAW